MKKFHHYDLTIGGYITHQGECLWVEELYSLKDLPEGARCYVYQRPGSTLWTRKTMNRGAKGGTRYEAYPLLSDAMRAGVRWAWRKDAEAAR